MSWASPTERSAYWPAASCCPRVCGRCLGAQVFLLRLSLRLSRGALTAGVGGGALVEVAHQLAQIFLLELRRLRDCVFRRRDKQEKPLNGLAMRLNMEPPGKTFCTGARTQNKGTPPMQVLCGKIPPSPWSLAQIHSVGPEPAGGCGTAAVADGQRVDLTRQGARNFRESHHDSTSLGSRRVRNAYCENSARRLSGRRRPVVPFKLRTMSNSWCVTGATAAAAKPMLLAHMDVVTAKRRTGRDPAKLVENGFSTVAALTTWKRVDDDLPAPQGRKYVPSATSSTSAATKKLRWPPRSRSPTSIAAHRCRAQSDGGGHARRRDRQAIVLRPTDAREDLRGLHANHPQRADAARRRAPTAPSTTSPPRC